MSIEIVNVVGGGKLGREVDLGNLHNDMDDDLAEYNPEKFAALVLRFNNPKATVMLFTSGKYSLAGAKSLDDAKLANQRFLSALEPYLGNITESTFEIRYAVCTADIGRSIDLNNAILNLGMNNTEYEPEQFPGVFYRPEDKDWHAVIFNSGKIVINGTPKMDVLQKASEYIQEYV